MNGVILAACVIGVLGLLIALLLGFAAIKLAVPVDEKEIAVREYLPGNNCGGCGYADVMLWQKQSQQEKHPLMHVL